MQYLRAEYLVLDVSHITVPWHNLSLVILIQKYKYNNVLP